MDKVKTFFVILGIGITIGIILMVVLTYGMGATLKELNIGGAKFEIPSPTALITNIPLTKPVLQIQSTPIPQVQPTLVPQSLPTITRSIAQPTAQQVITQSPLQIHKEPVSPTTLAKYVGGVATYWRQAGSYVWVYSNKDQNTLIRHPGDNMVLTYWANFGNMQNSSDCQSIISPTNSAERWVKCPSGTNAQIIADQVGLHLVDDTGSFR